MLLVKVEGLDIPVRRRAVTRRWRWTMAGRVERYPR